MLQTRLAATAVLSLLACSGSLWAGREYTAGPGEQVVPNQLLVKFKSGTPAAGVVAAFIQNAQITALNLKDYYVIRVPGGLPPGLTTSLAAHALVEIVEPDRVRRAILSSPNDPNYTNTTNGQWGLFTTQALQTWNLMGLQYLTSATAGTSRVKVAVLDTGADCTHPDFKNTGGSSTDSALGGQLLWSGSQAFVATTVASAACPWQDDHGHGTHVSGILAAATSNGAGVAALGYPLQLLEFKVLDVNGSGSDSTIANAITAAVTAGAKVISMSLGAPGYSPTLQAAIDNAWQNNVVVVAAAGNSATGSLFFPGGANHAVGVSASDINNNLASFSNFGNDVAVAAPGVGILSTVPTYTVTLGCCNYGFLSGTSMSTPFVSALAGLIAMTTPNASASAIIQRLEQTATSSVSGGAWGTSFGYGIINAYNAVAGVNRTSSTGGVVGQIVDTAGNPIGSAQITIGGLSFTTDSTGLYWLRSIAAGTYTALVTATGFASQSLAVTIAPGADTPLSVTMGAVYGSFRGIVTDRGAGVAGVIVQASANGRVAGTAVTDAGGNYTMWVPAGTGYTVQASQVGSSTASQTGQTAVSGGTTTVNLTIASLQGTIAGVVTDTHANPVSGAQVTISSSSLTATAVTNGSGAYSAGRLPTGVTYSVTATQSGVPPVTQSGVTVSADAITTVNLQVTPEPAGAPSFSPPGGTYLTSQNVIINSTTSGASIRYTTDGSTPTPTTGTLYSGPVVVTGAVTLQAVAYTNTIPASAVSSATYNVNPNAWYGTGGSWSNRKQVVINHAQVSGASALSNFPVLVSITDANLQSVAKADGSDILFTAADGVTKLNHEIEKYTSASGQLIAWVNVPAVSASADTVLYVYYGNPTAPPQQTPAATWDANYKGVFHLPDGSSLALTDSTGTSTFVNTKGVTATSGQIDGAGSFDGTSQALDASTAAVTAAPLTLEAWVKPTALTANGPTNGLILSLLKTNAWSGWYIQWAGSMFKATATSNSSFTSSSSSVLSLNTWYHVVGVFGSDSSRTIYVNGVAGTGDTTAKAPTFTPTEMHIGGIVGPGNWLPGVIDEVRISNVARSSGWIATEYNNQSTPGTFVTLGAQEIR
jgi:subtilisin family serine protease